MKKIGAENLEKVSFVKREHLKSGLARACLVLAPASAWEVHHHLLLLLLLLLSSLRGLSRLDRVRSCVVYQWRNIGATFTTVKWHRLQTHTAGFGKVCLISRAHGEVLSYHYDERLPLARSHTHTHMSQDRTLSSLPHAYKYVFVCVCGNSYYVIAKSVTPTAAASRWLDDTWSEGGGGGVFLFAFHLCIKNSWNCDLVIHL